jgi:hypothetical protein
VSAVAGGSNTIDASMGFLRSAWEGWGRILEEDVRRRRSQKLVGFIGAMPIYRERGPNVFLPGPEAEESEERENKDRGPSSRP